MINIHDIDSAAARFAGVLGALVSMRYLSGSWPARISMAISGAILSYYVSPWVSHRIGVPEGLAGFLLGLFGMAVVSRAWQAVQEFPISMLWQAVIDRVRGPGRG